jgi:hypothetical protein
LDIVTRSTEESKWVRRRHHSCGAALMRIIGHALRAVIVVFGASVLRVTL